MLNVPGCVCVCVYGKNAWTTPSYMKTGTRQVPFEERFQLKNTRKNVSYIGYFSGFILNSKLFHSKMLSFNHFIIVPNIIIKSMLCLFMKVNKNVTLFIVLHTSIGINLTADFTCFHSSLINTQFYLRGQLASKPQDILVPSHDRAFW